MGATLYITKQDGHNNSDSFNNILSDPTSTLFSQNISYDLSNKILFKQTNQCENMVRRDEQAKQKTKKIRKAITTNTKHKTTTTKSFISSITIWANSGIYVANVLRGLWTNQSY